MDELYKLDEYTLVHPTISSNNNLLGDGNYANSSTYGSFMSDHHHHQYYHQEAPHQVQVFTTTTTGDSPSLAQHPMEIMSDTVFKAQIASHPLYSTLLSAYIQCRKVGAPKEMVSLLEEICQENQHITNCTQIGADPELDEFMISYCELLQKYKEELSRPIDEATSFLSSIQNQLSNLCGETLQQTTISSLDGDQACHSDEDAGICEVEDTGRHGTDELKDMLLRKYSSHLSTLKTDFLKKRKKGKLPKDARVALLEWWNSHYRWPYPTEEEKTRLSDQTGLDHKQISNWFINQRKRHWKPSEEMRFALDMEGASGGVNKETMY